MQAKMKIHARIKPKNDKKQSDRKAIGLPIVKITSFSS